MKTPKPFFSILPFDVSRPHIGSRTEVSVAPEISELTMHFARSEASTHGLSVDQLITRALLAYVVETDRIQRGGDPK